MRRISPASRLARRHRQRGGQTLTEYALILAYIAVLAVQMLHNLGVATTRTFLQTNAALIISQNYRTDVARAQNIANQEAAVVNFLNAYPFQGQSPSESAESIYLVASYTTNICNQEP
jgi:Flp pilus assembly pilin Flp